VTLYDDIGGQAGVEDLVQDFYARVFADPVLRPFFEGHDHTKLVAMQHEIFGAALGGPVEYSGSNLAAAHAGRGIEARHLALFSGHMIDTLTGRGLSADDADLVVARIALYAEDVVGGVSEDG
jgi:hemoglobin